MVGGGSKRPWTAFDRLTGKYGDDSLVDGLDSLLLEDVAGEQGRYEKHNQNEERP